MPLPRQAEEAGKKADEMLKQFSEGAEADDDALEHEETVNDDDQAPEAADPDSGFEEGEAKAEDGAPEEDDEPAQPAEEPGFKHKYNVLKGKYDTEIGNMKTAIDSLQRQLQQALAQNQAQQQQRQEPKLPDIDASQVLSPEDMEAFADEGFDADSVNRFARMMNVISQNAVAPIGKAVTESASAAFDREVTAAHPDWREVNDTVEFNTFLDRPIPYAGGETFRQRIQLAVQKLDYTTATKIITDFKNTQKPATASANPKPQTTNPKRNLASQVAPGASRSSTPATQQGKIWTSKEIKKHYDDQARGAYKGREDVFDKNEKAINAAIRDGRVRN